MDCHFAMSGLVYAFVARDRGTVLAEHAALAGNFRSVGVECLSKGTFSDERFTVTADGYTFNFLLPPDGLGRWRPVLSLYCVYALAPGVALWGVLGVR